MKNFTAPSGMNSIVKHFLNSSGKCVGARICIIIFCQCWCFIVSCQVFIFSSSLVSFVSYQFCTCYIYLHIVYILVACNLFGQLSSLRKLSLHIQLWVSCFHLWFGHIRLVSILVYFALSFSSTFTHIQCKLFYAHSSVCNFLIFSYCIQQCVKFVLVKFKIRVISVCGYKVQILFEFSTREGLLLFKSGGV